MIALLRDIFEAVGLNLHLFPYGVLPTGPERGIIEVTLILILLSTLKGCAYVHAYCACGTCGAFSFCTGMVHGPLPNYNFGD